MRNLEPALTSAQNPRVKAWVKLSERKYRNQEGRFKLEGVHLVKEALEAGWPLEAVAFDEGLGVPDELAPYAEREGGSGNGETDWIPVSPDIIAKCSETETPQPVFAIALKRPADDAALFGGDGGPVVVLDGVQDPGNVGTIVRSAAASGAAAIVLGKGTADLFNAKTLRATMGTLFRVPIVEADLAELLPEAKRRGAKLFGTSLQAHLSIYECDLTGDGIWLLFGNEGGGLSPEVEALVERPVIIPMSGQAESLNVAMAATVLLFEAQRQRLGKLEAEIM
ncbi:TrmH family RNA methyltransferase [Cohnella nanjingensis]|uniref:RNA methyltransferase n=1 Tax=Cohnella nanjingensis TaxID=1387779 RepID=A0A7X0VFX0_9BACL|nr:RNA methyltransferase [Cohnella nanjingensis]MBB6672502.1 RNA methyltransferase [Cohnella nanjingensis]